MLHTGIHIPPHTHTCTQGSFQLLVSSEDADFDPDDLIDRSIFNRVMSPDGIWTPTIAVQGIYNAANIALKFRLSCNQDFYGPKCEVFCRSRDDSEGHYNCDVNGGKVCLSGWSDPANNCLTRECCLQQ